MIEFFPYNPFSKVRTEQSSIKWQKTQG